MSGGHRSGSAPAGAGPADATAYEDGIPIAQMPGGDVGYRKFTDRDGHQWEVHDRTRSEWELVPLGGNPNRERRVEAPGYEADPFELSEEELQRLLGETGGSGPARTKRSPFLD